MRPGEITVNPGVESVVAIIGIVAVVMMMISMLVELQG